MVLGLFGKKSRPQPGSAAGPAPILAQVPDDAAALRAALADCDRVHLACNQVVLPGWVNVDIDPFPGAYRWDLRQPLPLGENSPIRWIYSEHFIEHITREEALALMQRCYHTLQPGGVIRISTPDLAFMIEEYRANRISEWVPMGWAPETRCRMVNEGMRLWGHRFVYDRDELFALFREAGFSRIEPCSWRESRHDVLRSIESRPFHQELIVEAVR
jgi:predicted SAM-dependent methyltransferase